MPNITDPLAVRFSNERIRVAADRMAQAYYGGVALRDQFVALGSNRAALEALRDEFRKQGNRFLDAYTRANENKYLWLANSSPIPNTADPIIDGAPADGRQQITGAQANNVINRGNEYVDWLDTGLFTGGGVGGGAHRNTSVIPSREGKMLQNVSLADASNLISRIAEIEIEYEAVNNAKLNTLLAVAVNPTVAAIAP